MAGVVQVILFAVCMWYVLRERIRQRQWVPDDAIPFVKYSFLPTIAEEDEFLDDEDVGEL